MLDLLFPPLCSACGVRIGRKNQLCQRCLGQLKYLTPPWCSQCGIPQSYPTPCLACQRTSSSLDSVRSVFIYDDTLRNLIHQWKFKDHPELSVFFARQLILFMELYFTQRVWDFIVAVPLHPIRQRERDYNQSYLLAKILSQTLGIPSPTKMIRRLRPTLPQFTLTETQRKKNLKLAFQTLPGSACAKRILLVDDLYTTGATLNQCAESLKKEGALQVDGLTLARTALDSDGCHHANLATLSIK